MLSWISKLKSILEIINVVKNSVSQAKEVLEWLNTDKAQKVKIILQGVKQYIKNIFIWFDEGLNTVLAGDPDETLSSRAAKWTDAGFSWPEMIIDLIFGAGHCRSSLQEDRGEKEIFVDRDKQLHFVCGFFVCLLAGWLVIPFKGLFTAIGIGSLWGLRDIWRELKGKGVYDIWETGAIWAGGLAGYLLLLILNV